MKVFESNVLGRTLKARRKSRGQSLRGIGDKVGIPHSHVSAIECGRVIPSDPTLLKVLMRGFGMNRTEAVQEMFDLRVEYYREKYFIYKNLNRI